MATLDLSGLPLQRWYNNPQLVIIAEGRPWILSKSDTNRLLQESGTNLTIDSFPAYTGNVSATTINLDEARNKGYLEPRNKALKQVNSKNLGGFLNISDSNFLKEYNNYGILIGNTLYKVTNDGVFEIGSPDSPEGRAFSRDFGNKIIISDQERGLAPAGKNEYTTKEAYKYFTDEALAKVAVDTNNFGMGFPKNIPPESYTGRTYGKTSGGVQLYELQDGTVTNVAPPKGTKITSDGAQEARNKSMITNIPYRAGLNSQQQVSIENLIASNKSFNSTDAKNFAYATGQNNYTQFIGKNGQQALAIVTGTYQPTEQEIKSGIQPGSTTQPNQQPVSPNKNQAPQAGTVGALMPSGVPRIETAGNKEFFVKFTDDPTPTDPSSDASTVWLFNADTKIYTPFLSMEALEAFTGQPHEAIVPHINVVPTSFASSPEMKGQFLPATGGIKQDGIVPQSPSGQNVAGATNTYNQNPNPELQEGVANYLGIIFTRLKNEGAISQATFDSVFKDPALLAKYTTAVALGGYNFGDIFRDVKAKELGLNLRGISDTVSASDFYRTPEGQQIKSNTSLQVPSNIDIDPNIFQLPIFQIPGSAFTTLVPPIDWNSPEFKQEAEKIQATWYDLMLQQAQATTDQEKAIADDDWKRFKNDLNRRYGWQLSDNALQAWNQVQSFTNDFGSRGLATSGMADEARDVYLNSVRQADERLRLEKADKLDLEERNQLIKYGTPAEISLFVKSNAEKAKAYGLVPSQEVLDFANKNPELKGLLVDENGYMRSQLFQNLYTKQYDTKENKTTYQQSKLYQQKALEEEKAYAPYTRSNNPFSSYNPDYANISGIESTVTPSTIPSYISGTGANPDQFTSEQARQNNIQEPQKSFSLPTPFHEKISSPTDMPNYTDITSPGLDPTNPKALYGIRKTKIL